MAGVRVGAVRMDEAEGHSGGQRRGARHELLKGVRAAEEALRPPRPWPCASGQSWQARPERSLPSREVWSCVREGFAAAEGSAASVATKDPGPR